MCLIHAHESGFPEVAHGLGPAEDFLHPFAYPLAYLVTFVPVGAGVYAGAAFSGCVLGDMWSYVTQSAKCYEFEGVIAFVSAKGYSVGAGQAVIQHFKRCFPLRSAGGRGQLEVHK